MASIALPRGRWQAGQFPFRNTTTHRTTKAGSAPAGQTTGPRKPREKSIRKPRANTARKARKALCLPGTPVALEEPPCPKCAKVMRLVDVRGGKLMFGCSASPKCQALLNVRDYLVTENTEEDVRVAGTHGHRGEAKPPAHPTSAHRPPPKTTCRINRANFRDMANPIAVTIGGHQMEAEVKEFSTGSLGWSLNAKVTVEVNGTLVPVQVGLNLTIIGSKELP